MSVLLLIGPALLTPGAHAGLLRDMTEEERHVRFCQDAASSPEDDHAYARAVGVWQACLSEAQRLGYTEAVAMLEDQLALTRAMAAAAEWRASDPNRFALSVLSIAAAQRSVEYPTDVVAEVFRAWMGTEAGRGRLAAVRTITLDWSDPEGARPTPPKDREHATAVFRRYAQDLGLKWAEPGSDDVDVIIFGSISQADLDPLSTTRAGSLPRAEARFHAQRVRFRAADLNNVGFLTTATAESGDRAISREEALDEACQRGAARVLKQVLRVVFELPAR